MDTLLRETLALVLVEHFGRLPLDGLVAVRLRKRHPDVLSPQLEAIHLLSGRRRGVLAVEDDEGLALALQAALSNDLDDLAIVLEDGVENLLEVVDLLALVEVVDLQG